MSQTKAQLISDLVQALNFTGTASAPANGLFLSAANQLKLATASTERLKIDGTEVVINDTGANVDFRVEGDTSSHLLFLDAGNDRVGIKASSPATPLHVGGTIHTTTNVAIRITSSTNNLHVHQDDSDKSIAQFTNTATGSAAGDGFQIGLASSEDGLINMKESKSIFFKTADSDAMAIDSSQRVGIGTTSPSALLNLGVDTEANLGSGSEGIRITSGSSNAQFVKLGDSYSNNSVTGPGTLVYSSNKLSIRCDNSNPITFHTGSTVAERMRIDSDGRVKVNTANLLDAFQVDYGGGFNLVLDGAGNISQFRADGTVGGLTIETVITSGSFGANGGFISFKPKGSDAVFISGDGNLGIGTTSPGYTLDVKNNSTTAYSASSSPSNVIARVQNDSTQDDSHASFLLTARNDNTAMDFWWITVVSQSQNYNGFLAFSARTTSSSSQELVRFANNGRVSMQVLALGSGNSHNSAKLVIQGTGNTSNTNSVFIKNSDETPLFQVRNDGAFFTGIDGASPYNLTTSSTSNLVHVTNEGVLKRSTSSARYKKDIADATFGLADVLKLKPKTFKNNTTGEFADDKTYAGFTAEDIHDLGLTEFVEYNEANEPDSLAYGNMVALMAKAIQDLNAKVEALEAA